MKSRAAVALLALALTVTLVGCSPTPAKPQTKASAALLSKCSVIVADLNRLTIAHKVMDENIPIASMQEADLDTLSEDFATMHLDVLGLRKSEERDLTNAAAEAQALVVANRAHDGRLTDVAKLDLAGAALRFDCS
jgi:hypothetical protein